MKKFVALHLRRLADHIDPSWLRSVEIQHRAGKPVFVAIQLRDQRYAGHLVSALDVPIEFESRIS